MKQKFSNLLLIIFFVAFHLSAQNNEAKENQVIQWNGVQVWSAGAGTRNVVSFDGAVYPDDQLLPWFHKRINADLAFDYKVEISNETYVNLTREEAELVTTSTLGINNPVINTLYLRERGTDYLDISILPFVMRSGQIFKLKSFGLSIVKTKAANKSKAATLHTYATNSVLASGKFVQVRVVNSGIYKLTYEDLNSMGINPANVKVFGYGGAVLEQSFLLPKTDDLPEVSVYMEKGSDGIFNAGDYILFYAQGINKWTFDSSKNLYVHQVNPYSNYGYYFITSDAGTGKKIEEKAITVPEGKTLIPVTEFVDYNVYEKEMNGISIAQSGKEFYGDYFSENTRKDISFSFPNPVTTNSTKVRIDAASYSSAITSFDLSLDGSQTQSLLMPKRSESDLYEKGKAASAIFTYTPSKNDFNFSLVYSKSTSTSAGYLNFIEVNARRYLKMSGSVMQFQNTDYLNSNNYCQYQLSNADSKVQIWKISDPLNITRIPTQTIDSKLTFADEPDADNKYIAIDPTAASAFPKPEIVGVVPNQNLHALPQSDMVIITHPKFLSQAETLAQAHRDLDKLSVSVVTTDQVYNEFSSGAPDATAYRWVLKMLYDRAIASGNTASMPKYLLLFGRGTYDNRKLTPVSGENLILTYQADNSLVQTLSYVTDDYFGLLDDNEGVNIPSNLVDVGVGRFPVTTVEEAQIVVDKTIAYIKNTKKGIWKNQLCFLADDGDAALHMKQSDSITSVLARNYPAYQINKIYLDSYVQEISASGETYPLARTHLHDLIRNGLLLLNYTGHAGITGWTNELIMTVNDVKSFTNQQLPLWVGATCDFLQFDLKPISAGEQVLLNPNGGGIGIFSAARPVYASQNFTINRLFCDNLFKKNNGKHNRLGDVIAYAKNNTGSEINKLSYVYMGDPALQLDFPTDYNIKTTLINDNLYTGNDTLKAMSVVKISGIVDDGNGNINQNFNGELSMTVYDKVQRITTLNNHSDGALTYSDRPNILFSGKAIITNGAFTITFMLPKDIKYNYGGGRINYYAYDKTTGAEAQGFFENFIVGGTNLNVVKDTEGPEVNLFLNTENFVSGDQVNESPLFMANLSDVHGINRVGSGIGHDLLLTIDNDPGQSHVLNDYYLSAENTFTNGTVKYKLSGLTEGKHTLTFKAWDLMNNSTSKSIDFEVVKGLTPNILKIYNYPNPVKMNTRIYVEHDRPETVLNTKVEIFDVSGRLIWTFAQSNADEINWDLTGTDGQRVKKGIYIYRVSVSTSNSDVYSKSNKMLIIE